MGEVGQMPFVEITPEMRRTAYDFSKTIIAGNNQYDRMAPAYAKGETARNLVRINRTYMGKLAELCFAAYLRQSDICPDTDGMFEIYEGQDQVDAFDFNLPDGRTIDIKAAVFQNHHNLVVPIDQFQNSPKDFYVGVKFRCALTQNNYTLLDPSSFDAAEIKGYCTYGDLRGRDTVHLGEFPCKAYPLGRLRNIDDLIKLFES